MKNDQEILQSIRAAIDDCTRGIDDAPSLQYQIARKAKGEEPVIKKTSGALVLAIILVVMLASVAFAVTNGFGILNYHPEQTENKAYTDNIMSLNQTWEGEYFSATIHEAVFDGMKMSFTMTIIPKEGADPVYVIPRIRATAEGRELSTWTDGFVGGYEGDGFWIPCIEPDLEYDFDHIGVDIMLSDDYRTYAPVSENVEWEITFDILHPEWPIEFTESDEPMIGEPEWTDADYEIYDQQFVDAYRSKRILLNRAAMVEPFASAILDDIEMEDKMTHEDYVEMRLTQEAFSKKEQVLFRFTAEPLTVKHAKNPVSFTLPDGLVVQLQDLTVSVDEIGISLKITSPDSDEPLNLHDFANWHIAIFTDDADTKFLGAQCGPEEDGSGILYTAQWSINGQTDRLLLVPIDDSLREEFFKQQGTLSEEHRNGAICIDLE